MKHLVLILFILFAIPSGPALAQLGTSIAEPGVRIKIDPEYPAPNTSVKVSLDDYASVEKVTSITWRVDGEILEEGTNLRTINILTADAGDSIIIEAGITFVSGKTQSVSRTITPRYLDIIIEAQTKTPSFYLGRSLPSADSTVNITAILSHNSIPTSNLLYTWRLNNTVIGGGPQRGKDRISITTPPGGSFLVSLEVRTLNGNTLARRTISAPSVTPTLHFYEKTSLYGLSERSVTSLNVTGDSVTIQAEPYHLAIETYNQPDVVEWEINNLLTQNPNTNPYEITLSSGNQTFSASTIDFHVRNTDLLLQGARGQFRLNF